MGQSNLRGFEVTWSSFSDFAAMGGYGFYVWGSYGLTALAIASELFLLISRHHSAKRQLKQS